MDYDKLAETLHKGDTLASERIAELTDTRIGAQAFNLAVLQLCKGLMDAMRDRGRPATVAFLKGRVCVLTDAEAAAYNRHSFDSGLRKASRAFRRLGEVDTRKLSQEQREKHERALVVTGRVLANVRSTRAKIAAETRVNNNAAVGHIRSTPGLPNVASGATEETK